MILYQTEDGKTKIEVRLEDKTVWLSQHMMADLFKATKKISACISKMSLRNVFKEGELPEKRVVKECLTTATDDKNYRAKSYNLEAIISVGCRVKSHRGTQFRKWATEMLNEYLVKGFTMDDERPKEGKNIGSDYFDELPVVVFVYNRNA